MSDNEKVLNSLSKETKSFLKFCHFKKLTEVQIKTIPEMLNHHDVIVKSSTGSGKTLSFLIPILEILHKKKTEFEHNQIAALIISPTRELSMQIYQILKDLIVHFKGVKNLTCSILTSGKISNEEETKVSNIIVGTPGRLNKLFDEQIDTIDLKKFEVLIFDEADRLLEMGFEKEIGKILSKLPKQRRTGLFSATDCTIIDKISLRNVKQIRITEKSLSDEIGCPKELLNTYQILNPEMKFPVLLDFLVKTTAKKTVVFFLTCCVVDYFFMLSEGLIKNLKIFAIHGKMSKNRRYKMIENFRLEKSPSVLFSTDLMARGIDIVEIDSIIQFDIPQNPDFFVHRIGRTARMGRQGETLIFLMPFEINYLNILKDIKIPITKLAENDHEKAISSVKSNSILNPISISSRTRKMAENDRAVMEKGVKAFLSYIRGYREHLCKKVLPLGKMPFARVANAYGLLYMPRIFDIKEYPRRKKTDSVHGFVESETDIRNVKFSDKNQEKNRQDNIAQKVQKQKEEAMKRKENKKIAEKMTKVGIKRRRKMKRSKNQKYLEEWGELDREEKLYKKFKKKKISEKEYEIAIGERKRD